MNKDYQYSIRQQCPAIGTIRRIIMHNTHVAGACSHHFRPDADVHDIIEFRLSIRTIQIDEIGGVALGWRRGVVVTELVVSTKLLYVEPG